MSKESSKSGIGKLIVVIIIIIIIFAFIFFLSRHGLGFGSGIGLGNGSGNTESEALPAMAQISENETSQYNAQSTTVTILETYIEVKIDENNYLYNNTQYSIEEIDKLINELNQSTNTTVKIVEKEASLKAYNTLIDKLKENGIKFIELDSEESEVK